MSEWFVESARALLAAITPGEWEAVDGGAFSDDWWVKTPATGGPPLPDRNEANARFTAAAPSLVGWLLERLESEKAEADAAIRFLNDNNVRLTAELSVEIDKRVAVESEAERLLERLTEAEADRGQKAVEPTEAGSTQGPEENPRFLVGDDQYAICGVVSSSGPYREPLACGFPRAHEGNHAWASLPTWESLRRDWMHRT